MTANLVVRYFRIINIVGPLGRHSHMLIEPIWNRLCDLYHDWQKGQLLLYIDGPCAILLAPIWRGSRRLDYFESDTDTSNKIWVLDLCGSCRGIFSYEVSSENVQ
jgi:hypothetical protein